MKNEKLGILGAIGNTPIVELINLNGNPGVKIFGKLEGNNPGGYSKTAGRMPGRSGQLPGQPGDFRL